MKLCKYCKYWQEPDSEYGEIIESGTCKAVPPLWEVTQWAEDYTSRSIKAEYANTLAFVQDGSDYIARLKTLPNFWCVMWEEKT